MKKIGLNLFFFIAPVKVVTSLYESRQNPVLIGFTDPNCIVSQMQDKWYAPHTRDVGIL